MNCRYYDPWYKRSEYVAAAECWHFDSYSLKCRNQMNLEHRELECPWRGYPADTERRESADKDN